MEKNSIKRILRQERVEKNQADETGKNNICPQCEAKTQRVGKRAYETGIFQMRKCTKCGYQYKGELIEKIKKMTTRGKILEFWKKKPGFEIKESEKGCLCCGRRDPYDERFYQKTPNPENHAFSAWLDNSDRETGEENISCPYCGSAEFEAVFELNHLFDFKKGNCFCKKCENPFIALYS